MSTGPHESRPSIAGANRCWPSCSRHSVTSPAFRCSSTPASTRLADRWSTVRSMRSNASARVPSTCSSCLLSPLLVTRRSCLTVKRPSPVMAEHDAAEYDIVIPTIGRPSLDATLRSLETCAARPNRVVIVDDRRDGSTPLGAGTPIAPTTVTWAGGKGPANARNVGLAQCTSPWVVFLDDDVVVSSDWAADLEADLRNAEPRVAAIQGDVSVP